MKKVLAVVLAMAMMLSFVPLMVSAFDAIDGMVCLGAREDIEANPGETATFTIDLVCLPNPEDIPEGMTEDGKIYIQYIFSTSDFGNGPLAGIELTDEAKKAGAVILPFVEDNDQDDIEVKSGWVSLPAKYFFNSQITLFKADVAVSSEWSVVDYVAENPIPFNVEVGVVFYVPQGGEDVVNAYEYMENCDNEGIEICYITVMYGNGGTIYAKPYQPKFFEKVWEWIKEKIRFLIDLDNIVDNLLYTKVFNPADWYDDYMLRKQAGKA